MSHTQPIHQHRPLLIRRQQIGNYNIYLPIQRNGADCPEQNVRRLPRRNLQLYKQKIIAAKKGHELLKRKADALKAKFRRIMDLLLKSKKKMGEECQQALYLFSEAKYAAGDFQYTFLITSETMSRRPSREPASAWTKRKRISRVCCFRT